MVAPKVLFPNFALVSIFAAAATTECRNDSTPLASASTDTTNVASLPCTRGIPTFPRVGCQVNWFVRDATVVRSRCCGSWPRQGSDQYYRWTRASHLR